MKYLAILSQVGGCDYTIGCGTKTIQFEAENTMAAGFKLQEIVKRDYSSEEMKLDAITFFEVGSSYEVDLKIWYSKIDEEKTIAKQNAIRTRELEELERLKKKYNK